MLSIVLAVAFAECIATRRTKIGPSCRRAALIGALTVFLTFNAFNIQGEGDLDRGEQHVGNMGDGGGQQAENIFGPGDLDLMFRRIVFEAPPKNEYKEFEQGTMPQYLPVIHSRPSPVPPWPYNAHSTSHQPPAVGPWVVTLENFITDDECDHLVKLGK